MTARATAERHAQDVVDGNLSRLMGDFSGSVLTELMGSGDRARFGEQARALRSLLQLSASPVAIGFHTTLPTEPPRFDGVMSAPAPDGRTGRRWRNHQRLDDLLERLAVVAEANRAVARYAGADASRFAVRS